MRILLIAALVLSIFALLATQADNQLWWTATWNVWLVSALIAYFADLLLGETIVTRVGAWRGRRSEVVVQEAPPAV